MYCYSAFFYWHRLAHSLQTLFISVVSGSCVLKSINIYENIRLKFVTIFESFHMVFWSTDFFISYWLSGCSWQKWNVPLERAIVRF